MPRRSGRRPSAGLGRRWPGPTGGLGQRRTDQSGPAPGGQLLAADGFPLGIALSWDESGPAPGGQLLAADGSRSAPGGGRVGVTGHGLTEENGETREEYGGCGQYENRRKRGRGELAAAVTGTLKPALIPC
jgi:hypothetical protein